MTNLTHGLLLALEPTTFALMVLSVLGGIVVGALPGMTSSMGIILLLPFTYRMDEKAALLMLAGMYCGSMMGGSFSAILLRTPGTPSAAATLLDGYPLTEQGKAGKALTTAVVSSFAGGLVSTVCLVLIAPTLARVALEFGAAEYFSLAVFGLTIMASASGKNILKGLIAGCVGLLVSTVGIDMVMGRERFTFGILSLSNGFALLPVLIGIFAVSQVLAEAEVLKQPGEVVRQVTDTRLAASELRSIAFPIAIGCVIGTIIGVIPGTGGSIACFLAYQEAQRWSKNREKFGHGALEGVAAPEAANNAVTGGALVPMLTLGIPGDVVTSVMLGALMLIGVRPGPLLFMEDPDVAYTLLSGMFLIQFVMLALGLASIRAAKSVLAVPYNILMPVIMVLCVVGAYTLQNSLWDVGVAVAFGVVGYFMRKMSYPGAPLVLGVILGPMIEDQLNRALLIARNDWTVLLRRPISLMFLCMAVLSIVFSVVSVRRSTKQSVAASS